MRRDVWTGIINLPTFFLGSIYGSTVNFEGFVRKIVHLFGFVTFYEPDWRCFFPPLVSFGYGYGSLHIRSLGSFKESHGKKNPVG